MKMIIDLENSDKIIGIYHLTVTFFEDNIMDWYHGFPSWDFHFEIFEWLEKNCKNSYFIICNVLFIDSKFYQNHQNLISINFENNDDALLFKLTCM